MFSRKGAVDRRTIVIELPSQVTEALPSNLDYAQRVSVMESRAARARSQFRAAISELRRLDPALRIVAAGRISPVVRITTTEVVIEQIRALTGVQVHEDTAAFQLAGATLAPIEKTEPKGRRVRRKVSTLSTKHPV
jgi:hypothetical protein